MEDVSQLKEKAKILVEEWKKTTQDKPTNEQSRDYNQILDQLYEKGWDNVLGFESELPDENLPSRYLETRAEIIDQLEFRLGDLAALYRKSRRLKDSSEEMKSILEYSRVIEKLFWIGWNAMLYPDSELPDEHMPRIYLDYWKKAIEHYRKGSS
jgi:hypothetical protein